MIFPIQRAIRWAEARELELRLLSGVVQRVVRVLESFYRLDRGRIAERMHAFITCPGIRAETRSRLVEALAVYRDCKVDFTDALLAGAMRAQRVRHILSFDRRFLRRVPWIRPLE